MYPRHLLSLRETSRDEIRFLLDTARSLSSGPSEAPPRKTVALLPFDSDATMRALVERACRRLGFDLMALSVTRDDGVAATVRAAHALGADAVVLRHPLAGAPWGAARHFEGAVVNGGDGANEQPVRGLIDLLTLDGLVPRLEDLQVAIVGAIGLSAPGRSLLWGLRQMGARVTLVGPPTMGADALAGDGVTVTHDLDGALRDADAVYVLPLPPDGPQRCLYPSVSEYAQLFGIDAQRLSVASRPIAVLHPGPLGREVGGDLGLAALRERQLRDGVAMWSAVLMTLLGGRPDAVAA